jgi:acetyl esterase/lipase
MKTSFRLITTLLLAPLAALSAAEATAPATPRQQFVPDQIWPDNNGVHINAHGGGVMAHDGTYYWFGQHMIAGKEGNEAHVGVHCYSSTDLYNWKDEGIALKVSDDPKSDIAKGCILERPKVIYNVATRKFVMWFHLELKSMGYKAARSGVAVADRPAGPYTFLRSLRPDAGAWPVNVTEAQKSGLKEAEKLIGSSFVGGPNAEVPKLNLVARDLAGGQMARDMNLFVDDDGKAYHLFASEENSTLHISQLSDDYQSHAGKWVRIFEHRWHEAPAMCKHAGKYWLITSGCTGWYPNAARAAVADSIWGPWKELENPCVGVNPHNKIGPEKTFGGQSTCILPVQGRPGAFIAMFDVWRPDDAITGGHIWLPIEFGNDRFTITWRDAWNLNVFAPPPAAKPNAKPASVPAYVASVPKPTLSEVRYGTHERQVLDFWKAESATPTPVVFVIHGGGWQNGSKEIVHKSVDVAALLKAGISVAAINYRFIPMAVAEGIKPPVKAPLHDAARALQLVRSKAAEWNIDKKRIGATGGSAGACSSLWLAFHDDLADPNSADPVARESTRLLCAAVIGAQTPLDPQQMVEWTPNSKYGGHAFGFKGFPEFLAGRETILPWIAEYSPFALVSKDDPGVYLTFSAPPALGQNQKDPTHTANFGVRLQEHCKAIGVPCELRFPGAPDLKHETPTDFLIAKLTEK